MNFRCHTYLLT